MDEDSGVGVIGVCGPEEHAAEQTSEVTRSQLVEKLVIATLEVVTSATPQDSG